MIDAFDVLFSEIAPGASLPQDLQRIYGGDLPEPAAGAALPVISTNFVVSHDGRISFELAGQRGGHAISGRSRHDHWLMELLRARADAVLIGAGTLRAAPRHAWRPGELIDAAAFSALRHTSGRRDWPDVILLTTSGDIPLHAAALQGSRRVFILTGDQGAARLPALPPHMHLLRGLDQPDGLPTLLAQLRWEFGILSILSEGGGRTYGSLLGCGAIDDIFLTRSPLIVGNPAAPHAARPTLVEGIAFTPATAPRLRLLSLRRADGLLFEHLCPAASRSGDGSARIQAATA